MSYTNELFLAASAANDENKAIITPINRALVFINRSIGESLKLVYASAEQCEIIYSRVFGIEFAQTGGELFDSAAVVLLAVEQSECSGGIARMDIEGYIELRGSEHFPHAEVYDAVVAHEPSQGHVEPL